MNDFISEDDLQQRLEEAYNLGHYALIVEYAQQLAVLDARNERYPLMIGQAFVQLGQTDSARKRFAQSIELAGAAIENVHAEYAARPLTWDNVVEASAEERFRADEHERMRDIAHVCLADTWRNEGNLQRFESVMTSALRGHPESVFLHYAMATHYLETKQPTEAARLCKACAQFPPYCGTTDEWMQLASLCQNLGLDHETALIAAHQSALTENNCDRLPPMEMD